MSTAGSTKAAETSVDGERPQALPAPAGALLVWLRASASTKAPVIAAHLSTRASAVPYAAMAVGRQSSRRLAGGPRFACYGFALTTIDPTIPSDSWGKHTR